MSLKAMREAIKNKPVPGAKSEKPKPPAPKVAASPKKKEPPKPPNSKERKKAKQKEESILGRYPDETVITQKWDAKKGCYVGTLEVPIKDAGTSMTFNRTHTALHQLIRDFWRKDFVPWAKANGIPIVQQPPVKAEPKPEGPK